MLTFQKLSYYVVALSELWKTKGGYVQFQRHIPEVFMISVYTKEKIVGNTEEGGNTGTEVFRFR